MLFFRSGLFVVGPESASGHLNELITLNNSVILINSPF